MDNRAKRCLDELEQGSDQGARPLLLPGESRRRDSRMIAALYVESRGVYAGLPDVDLWDRDRDARTYRRTLASGRAPAMRQMGTVLLGAATRPSSRGSSWETTRDASSRPWTRCDGTAVSWSPQRPALRGPAFGLLTPPRARGWS